jgi:hypothetical protein
MHINLHFVSHKVHNYVLHPAFTLLQLLTTLSLAITVDSSIKLHHHHHDSVTHLSTGSEERLINPRTFSASISPIIITTILN